MFCREEATNLFERNPFRKNMCGKTWKNLQVHNEAHFILDSVQVGKGHLAIVKKKKKRMGCQLKA